MKWNRWLHRCRQRLGRLWLAFTLVLGAVCCPATLSSQDSLPPLLRGLVVDTAGAPIASAQVIAVEEDGSSNEPTLATTTTQGRFVFQTLGPGRYAIIVRRIGFVPLRTTLTLVEGEPRVVRFELVPLPQILEEVLVEVPGLATDDQSRRAFRPPFRGIIVDSGGRPIPNAEIILAGSTRATREPGRRVAGGTGTFEFRELRPGRYFVTVRHIGHVPIRTALTFEEGSPRAIRFEMHPMPQNLPDIVVEATRFDIGKIGGRISRNEGRLLTRDDLARLAPAVLGEALTPHLPAVRPDTYDEPSLGFSRPRSGDIDYGLGPANAAARQAQRFRGRDCPPVISVNGQAARAGWAVNDFDPDDIEAIEVYRRRDRIPTEFQDDLLVRRSCGSLMVIWLKQGRIVQ